MTTPRQQALWAAQDVFTRAFTNSLLLWHFARTADDGDCRWLHSSYSGANLSYETLLRIERECQLFQLRAGLAITAQLHRAGEVFFYSRNRAGLQFSHDPHAWCGRAKYLDALSRRFPQLHTESDVSGQTIRVTWLLG